MTVSLPYGTCTAAAKRPSHLVRGGAEVEAEDVREPAPDEGPHLVHGHPATEELRERGHPVLRQATGDDAVEPGQIDVAVHARSRGA